MPFTIPPIFAIWASPNPQEMEDWTACLVTVGQSIDNNYTMKLMANPTDLIGHAILKQSNRDEWLQGQKVSIEVDRLSVKKNSYQSISTLKTHTTTVFYNNHFIHDTVNNQKIPVLRLTNPNVCIGSRFSRIKEPDQVWYSFEMKPNQPIPHLSERLARRLTPPPPPVQPRPPIQPPTQPPTQHPTQSTNTYKMPQHIVNAFLDSLFQKAESCPITGEPLEKLATYLTPCGHAISFEAANGWIPQHATCPVCRTKCTMGLLELYK